MLIIATQPMATSIGAVTTDDAIECTDEQGEKLISAGLARLPDADDGEPTPRQKRCAFRWPADDLQSAEDGVSDTKDKETAKPNRAKSRKKATDGSNKEGDPPVSA